MSAERYSTMDEPSLRNLLDGTKDLDERRLIRSAIRELRRREIEDMEADLASKRFRPTCLTQNDNKENQLTNRSGLADSLHVLSVKLQTIHDVEELTALLHGATEYEERKLIRAAIRGLGDEQQQGMGQKERTTSRCLETEVLDLQSNQRTVNAEKERLGEGERIGSQEQELHRTGTKSGMVLVLDPLVKEEVSGPLLTCSQTREPVTLSEPNMVLSNHQSSDPGAWDRSLSSRPRLNSGASEKSLGQGSAYRSRVDSGASEKSLGQGSAYRSRIDSGASEKSLVQVSAYRTRLDSGASDRSQCSSSRGRLGSGASESCFRPRLDSGTSDSSMGLPASVTTEKQDSAGPLSCKRLDSGPSDLGVAMSVGPALEQEVRMSSCSSSTDSDAETTNHHPAKSQNEGSTTSHDAPDGGILSRKVPSAYNGIHNGSSRGSRDIQEQKVRNTALTSFCKVTDTVPEKQPFVLAPFGRANSVRDRMRKFTEPSPSVPVLKRGSQSVRNSAVTGGRVLGGASQLSEGPAAGPTWQTPGSTERLGRPHLGTSSCSTSSTDNRVQHQGAVQPGGVASKTLQNASQSLNAVGGTRQPAEKLLHNAGSSKEEKSPGTQQDTQGEEEADMKTFLTIEIKDGHTTTTTSSRGNMTSVTPMAPRITSSSMGQRAELTLGLRPSPFKVSTSGTSFKMEQGSLRASEKGFAVEPSVQVTCCQVPAAVPNGSSSSLAKAEEHSGKLTAEQLDAIDDEELLDKMLDESKDFEERKMIRQAMRDLRKRKRDLREKERQVRLAELQKQRDERSQKGCAGGGAGEVVMRKVEKSVDGSTLSQLTKTDRFAQSGDGSRTAHSTIMESSYVKKTDMGTVQSKSYSFSSTSSSSSSSRKVGSVFDREDDTASRAAERRQAEKRKELTRAQTLPKASAAQSRKAMIDKLEKESGGLGNKAVVKVNTVQRSASCMVPNANSIKQMLLDWCRAKTRSYENVDIQNFSSSWSDGMAFCALVHNFFPEAFDYSSLNPANRRHNFEVAFSTAEKLADCPVLLDVEDMVRMREPDWKCVYTYLQEFYRGLVTKGLVKTKHSR
ncbi:hypothetical protein UPYG_G00184240 [Umbra pygmaea]|uniref:Calponin-homology (CH) domain-containing protein n=1 Tax=Umbra pygmaea TaxID=75934 RepID=A0ABD0WRB0_UMBPY